ncbi:MAG TPA: DNA helicase UvrB [bacterium (Candidatus Stahlbacteria)]|nr:DNA helicase UvrB [Candidatus Stahlbacteria bacterium]
MLCDNCKKKKATIQIKEIGPDQKIVILNLCDECAEKKGILIKHQVSPIEKLHAILTKTKRVDLVCPNCGLTFTDFKKHGRFGCSQCYEVFRTEIEEIIANIHGARSHSGRKPGQGEKPQNQRIKMMRLRDELKRALEKEEYERAAEIRDQIRRLVQNE